MRSHIAVVAWLHIVLNGIVLVIVGLAGLAMLGIGGLAAAGAGSDFGVLFGIFSGLATILMIIGAVLALPGLLGGIGLLQRASWGRILTIIVSILGLLNFPVGTAVGIYSLVVLFNEDVAREFM